MCENRVENYENTTSKEVFTIECKDIILREFQLEDLDELHNITLQPEITDFLPDWIGTKQEHREWLIDTYIPSNEEFLNAVPNVDGKWVICGIVLKDTNEFIGWCCSGPCDELPEPNREIGYAISKYHRNKGYTTQAVEGMIKYLFENTNVQVLNAMALTHNIPSNRVIEKCGFNYTNNIQVGKREFKGYKLNKDE